MIEPSLFDIFTRQRNIPARRFCITIFFFLMLRFINLRLCRTLGQGVQSDLTRPTFFYMDKKNQARNVLSGSDISSSTESESKLIELNWWTDDRLIFRST